MGMHWYDWWILVVVVVVLDVVVVTVDIHGEVL